MTRDVTGEIAHLRAELDRRKREYEAALQEHDEHRRALLALLEDLEAGRQKIEQAQREWNAAFDAVIDPIFLHDRDFRVVRANRAYAARAGLPFKEILGRPYWEVFPKGTGPLTACRHVIEGAVEEGAGEEELRLESGEVFLSRSFPVRDAHGAWLYGVHLLMDVTGQRRVEHALRESEEKFHRITAVAQDAILMMDNDGRIVFWNTAAERIFGYTAQAALGQELHQLLAPERYHDDYRKGFARFRGTGEGPVIGKTLELVARRQGGAEFPVELSVSALTLGDRWHAVGVLRDITERKQAEESLREREARYRTLAENLPGIVYRVHVRENNRMQFFNKVATDVTGYTVEELAVGEVCSLDPLIVPEDRERVIATVKGAIAENRPFTAEYRLRHKNGDIRHLLEQGTPIPGPDGKVLYIDGVVFDVTERKRAEQEIERSKELLEHMFESIHVLVAYMDRDFNFLRVNRAYAEADGRTPEFFPGKNHFALYPDKDVESIFRRAVETGEPYVAIERPFEYAEHPARGVSYWDWRVEPVKDAGGRVEGVIFSLLNVTERKQTLEQLRASRNLLQSVVENAPIRVFWKDRESRYLGCNSAFAHDAGLTRPEELLGKDDFQMGWREQAELYRADDRRVMDSGVPKLGFEEPQTTPDGRTIWLRTSKVPLRDTGGNVFGLLGIYEDITEQKRATLALKHSETSLAEAQRIAHLGSWELDLATNKLTWSDEIYRIFEIDPQQFGASYEAFLDAIHPDDRAMVDRAYTESVKRRVPYDIVHRLSFKDGRIKYVHERCETTYDAAGAPLRSLGTVQDITERKLAEIALSRVNRALKTLSAGNEVLVRAADETALLQEMCRILVELGGYRMAWVGFDGSGAPEKLRPVARAGHDDGFVDALHAVWMNPEREQIPTIRALRSGAAQAITNIETAPMPSALAPWREEALKRGYRACLALPLSDQGRPFGVLDIFAADPGAFDDEEIRLLQELAADLAYGVVNLRARVERARGAERLRESLADTIRAIALTVEKRDPYTAGHQNKVAELCVAIGRELGLDESRIEGLRLGATIHDIGKIYIPAEILNRPGKLTPAEFEIIKSHAEVGYDIVKDVKFPWPVGQMILQHHERLDGTGYPKGLKGEEVILEARILAVADVVEAMSSHRPYRPARGPEMALAEVEQHRGTRYDAAVVDACLKLLREKGFAFAQ